MARLAVSELTTFRWSFEEDLEHYRALGIEAIGIWRHKLADVGDEHGAQLLRQSGLTASSLQWAGGFTGSEGHSHEESIQDARAAISAAQLLRAGCLIVHSGARGVHTNNHARRLFRLALDALLPEAERARSVLAVEPMHGGCGGDFTFLHCLDETVELIKNYDSPFLRIALDTFHWGHEPALLGYLPELAPRLALVQLGDSRQPPAGEPNRCRLGEGVVPLREIISTLTAAGYDGFYEIELMGEEIEAADYREVVVCSAEKFRLWSAEAGKRAASSARP